MKKILKTIIYDLPSSQFQDFFHIIVFESFFDTIALLKKILWF